MLDFETFAMLKPKSFFDLETQRPKDLFTGFSQVWQVIPEIKKFASASLASSVKDLRQKGGILLQTHVIWQGETITENLEILPEHEASSSIRVIHNGRPLEGAVILYAGAAIMDGDIEIGSGTIVEPGALIKGPTIIGSNTEIRQGAYIRGACIVGNDCVVGHATEMKNSIMLNHAKAGHFAYVGDSILGRNVNLGAGTKLANFKVSSGPIKLKIDGELLSLPLRKIGAVLGDDTATGCNSVTSPGTFIGPGSVVAANTTVNSGVYKSRSVIRPKV